MHTHLSLFEGDRNAFHEAGADVPALEGGPAFIAGLLTHAAGDHRGHQPVGELLQAAVRRRRGAAYVCWGHNNRSALVRVPMYKPRKGQSTRVEFRSPDSACNPYLAFAVLLAAGLKGIEEGYELPEAPRTTSGRSPRPSAGRWASTRCRRTWPRRSR